MSVLSTAHLTSLDLTEISPGTTPHCIGETKHAFLFYVPSNPDDIDESLAPHIKKILRQARRDKIAYVMFDGDGPTSPRFKRFLHV